MFISDTHLPQLLPAHAYHDEAWYEREVEKALLPAWHVVATSGDFPRDGSFVSLKLLGRPLLLRRDGGEIHGFLNVCPHRFATLTDAPRGCTAVLKCGYHGWEFDGCSGATRRIPDAPAFRPLEKGQLGLTQVQVEVCGGLVFVSVGQPQQSVTTQLAACDCDPAVHTSQHGEIGRREVLLPVNWKVAVENTLESYHVAEVHPRTFTTAPPENACRHELTTAGSCFSGPGDTRRTVVGLERLLLGRLGLSRHGGYRHTHLHPTFTLAATDSFAILLSFLPESARLTRLVVAWFARQSGSSRTLADRLLRIWAGMQSRFWLQVVGEDAAIVPRVQAGLEATAQPGGGLISRREERIVHFQRWLLDRLELPVPVAAQPMSQGAVP